jgi:hypothetical protein
LNVLIIAENPQNDRHILIPIIKAMFGSLGRSKVNIDVCRNHPAGIQKALDWNFIAEIIDDYMYKTDFFMLCVDRDGEEKRDEKLRKLEQNAEGFLTAQNRSSIFLAENAWQEIEVWVLAGLRDLPSNWGWQEVRQEKHPKETYYEPYARDRGILNSPGQGRKTLGQEAARSYGRIKQLCPEDIANLEDRLKMQLVNF